MSTDQGRSPARADPDKKEYLRNRIEGVRKDCQWLVGVGAASVFGIAVSNQLGTAGTRRMVFALVASQIVIALVGATSLLRQRVDQADVIAHLRRTLIVRYRLRNLSLLLLAAGFLYLGATTLL